MTSALNWSAIVLTLKLAGLTSLILVALGLPVAYWISNSRRRWKFIVESIVALPLVLPPTVLGFYILVTIGPNAWPGCLYERLTGSQLPFTFQGLLVASVLYSLPFAVQPFVAALSAVDRRLIEASWTLGVSRIGTFFRVILPQAGYGVLTGIILSFAHTLGEFGVVLMVGGDIDGVTRTVSIDIYDSVQALDYPSAARTSMALLVFSFAVLSIVYALNRRIWAAGPEFRK